MKRRAPLFDRPHPGWQEDLPGPYDAPSQTPRLDRPPIQMTDVVLEVSRRSARRRGFAVYCAPLLIAVMLYQYFHLVIFFLDDSFSITEEIIFIVVGSSFLYTWAIVLMLRQDIAAPRDEPIRFNRMRRQVYVYAFHPSWWNPFSTWPLTTEQYDWDDLRAEVWRRRGATPNGGLIITWGVSIAVIKPGTNKVVARFPLSLGEDEGNSWAYVCTFMQQGPQALPPVAEFSDANAASRFDLARRFAPKVQWPAEMDAESRSAI